MRSRATCGAGTGAGHTTQRTSTEARAFAGQSVSPVACDVVQTSEPPNAKSTPSTTTVGKRKRAVGMGANRIHMLCSGANIVVSCRGTWLRPRIEYLRRPFHAHLAIHPISAHRRLGACLGSERTGVQCKELLRGKLFTKLAVSRLACRCALGRVAAAS